MTQPPPCVQPWLPFWTWWVQYQVTTEQVAPDGAAHVAANPEEDKEADPGLE